MADDKTTEKKTSNKGRVEDYNKIPVVQRDFYYDVTDSGEPGKPSGTGTDSETKKDFSDMFFDLKQMNIRIKERLNKDKLVLPTKENDNTEK